MRLAAAVTALSIPLLPTPAAATDGGCWDTAWRCHDLETVHGPLDQDRDLQDQAKAWAREMADSGILRHSTEGSDGYSEIVGTGPDWKTVVIAWMDSAPHRAILTDPTLTQVGIGSAGEGPRRWYVVQFAH